MTDRPHDDFIDDELPDADEPDDPDALPTDASPHGGEALERVAPPFDPDDLPLGLDEDLDINDLETDVDEFADEQAARVAASPPPEGPDTLGPGFYEAGVDLHALDDLVLAGRPSVLERLGPAHFRSRGFSFMGFLQTVYDHVAEQVKKDDAWAAVPPDPTPTALDTAPPDPAPAPPDGTPGA